MPGQPTQVPANPYRRRILESIEEVLAPYAPFGRMLDFGAGDGWFARSMPARGLGSRVIPVDVVRRRRPLREPILYDGGRLPFADRSFDLVYAVDVLHHTDDPAASLRELMRCTASFMLVKDHTYRSRLGWLTLCLLDEIGNRRFGIPSVYRYQCGWEWSAVLEANGFRSVRRIHPMRCHVGLLGRLTNRLQYLELWRRGGS